MEAVTVGSAKAVVAIISAKERRQTGYTFMAAKMGNVTLMLKKRIKTAHNLV